MIDVLLATCRPDTGMLKAQIDSIRMQRDVELNLIVREDAAGEGACANFARLLEMSTADYCAFADQDDVWLPDKLARLLAKMRELEAQYGKTTPLLVFGDAIVVDAGLREISPSLFKHTKIDPSRVRPEQLVLQNVANGNTMLFNAALRDLARPIPPQAFMHDHWLMLAASSFGKIAHIDGPLLYYRQHGGNVLGGAKVGIGYFARKLREGRRKLRQRLYANIVQAEAFVARFGDASPGCLQALVGIDRKPYWRRVGILAANRIAKNGWLRNLGTALII